MNNNRFIIFGTFVVGLGIGVASTRKYYKNKYEQLAQEEIDSVKEVFRRRERSDEKLSDDIFIHDNESIMNDYFNKLQEEGYAYCSEKEEPVKNEIDIPYVITPEEFSEYDDYDNISLTYYADGVLTYENNEIIEDIEETVGEDSLNHFGEYEEDSVYVRNDGKKTDYEILLDLRNYSDVIKYEPHPMEV
jgi:hypothetical protein